MLDNFIFNDTINRDLTIRVRPDPDNFTLVNTGVIPARSTSATIHIQAMHLDSVLRDEIFVAVSNRTCTISAIETDSVPNLIVCIFIPDHISTKFNAPVQISIGNIDKVIGHVVFEGKQAASSNTLILSFVIPMSLLLSCSAVVIVSVVLIFRKKYKKEFMERHNLAAQMVELRSRSHHKLDDLTEELIRILPANLIIPRCNLHVLDMPLGQGQFGIVYKAYLVNTVCHQSQPVAVKILKGTLSKECIQNMLLETSHMAKLSHPNVMTLLGVCINESQGPSIVMPYMANGSLLEYLKRERQRLYVAFDAEQSIILSTRKLLVRICYQISLGMAYLTLQKVIHRDLAARNCMIDSDGTVKVSDFGLSEDVYTTGYFRQNRESHVRLPFKWMALESLTDGVFNEKTDVWSFGVTCWEVFSAGRTPYPAVDPVDLPRLLQEGMRLEYPSNAANAPEIYSVMYSCWKLLPTDRPSFDAISLLYMERMKEAADYLELTWSLQANDYDGDDSQEYESMRSIRPSMASMRSTMASENTLKKESHESMNVYQHT